MGRPSEIERKGPLVIEAISYGMRQADAAAAAGVDPGTVSRWLARGKSKKKDDRPYRVFRSELHQARDGRGRFELLRMIHEHAKTDWRAAAALLRTRYPEDYSERFRIERMRTRVAHQGLDGLRPERDPAAEEEAVEEALDDIQAYLRADP